MYVPKHMNREDLRKCKCGHAPSLLKIVDGYDIVYQVKCPVCKARTWGKLTALGAKLSWNRGELACPNR